MSPREASIFNFAKISNALIEGDGPDYYYIGIPFSNVISYQYVVNAAHEEEAVDKLADWLEENKETQLFYSDEESTGEYIIAGNHCLMMHLPTVVKLIR